MQVVLVRRGLIPLSQMDKIVNEFDALVAEASRSSDNDNDNDNNNSYGTATIAETEVKIARRLLKQCLK